MRGTGAAIVMPHAHTEATQVHLEEIARTVARQAHAVLVLDRAGWHVTDKLVVPPNITLIFLPPRSPDLNPVENIWQYMRATWALEPGVRHLPRHRRRHLRGLE